MQYKIENDTLIPAPVNFRTPDGRTICNFFSSPELMTRYGYTITEAEAEEWREAHPAPEPPARTTCTKYELVRALRKYFPDLLVQLQRAYSSDDELQFYWNSVNDLDRDNHDFKSAIDKLGISGETLDSIFAKIGQ